MPECNVVTIVIPQVDAMLFLGYGNVREVTIDIPQVDAMFF